MSWDGEWRGLLRTLAFVVLLAAYCIVFGYMAGRSAAESIVAQHVCESRGFTHGRWENDAVQCWRVEVVK